MCGRYALEHVEDLSERFHARHIHFDLPAQYNIAPSLQLPVVVQDVDGDRVVQLMQWGLIPRWQPAGRLRSLAPINARAESVASKPMFRDSIRWRRCLIPASGFYVWRPEGARKQPYFVTDRGQKLFAFAGIYDEVVSLESLPDTSFAILSTRPNACISELQSRMPVIVRPADEGRWLSRQISDVDDLQQLFEPLSSDEVAVHPVSPLVNDVRCDGPELIQPHVPVQLPLVRLAS